VQVTCSKSTGTRCLQVSTATAGPNLGHILAREVSSVGSDLRTLHHIRCVEDHARRGRSGGMLARNVRSPFERDTVEPSPVRAHHAAMSSAYQYNSLSIALSHMLDGACSSTSETRGDVFARAAAQAGALCAHRAGAGLRQQLAAYNDQSSVHAKVTRDRTGSPRVGSFSRPSW
jgi:hypothetical protein